VNELTHVINYNQPDEAEVYIHRSGRTGRAGKRGISISIIHKREMKKIAHLEKLVGKKFSRRMVPNGKEICEKQLFNLVDKMEKTVVDTEQIEPFMEVIYKKLEWLSREELIQKFVSVEFNRFLEYYKNTRDLNVDVNQVDRKERKKTKKGRAQRDEDFARFHINVGSKSNVSPSQLIGMINDATKTRDLEVGRIEILKKFSFFEVPQAEKDFILESFRDFDYKGMEISVEEAQSRREDAAGRGRQFKKSRSKSGKGKRYGDSGGRRGGDSGKRRKFSGRKGR
jgi:ATP-dependent RNA helicase DeaD